MLEAPFLCVYVGICVPEMGGPIRDSIGYIYFERLCLEVCVEWQTQEATPDCQPLPLFFKVKV